MLQKTGLVNGNQQLQTVVTLKGKVGKVCKDTLCMFAGEYDLLCMHACSTTHCYMT